MTTKTKTRKRRVDYRRAPRRMHRVPMEKRFNYFTAPEGHQALQIPILASEIGISHRGEKRSITWHNFLIGYCETSWTTINGKRTDGWTFTLHLETGWEHPTNKNRQFVFSRTFPTPEQIARYIPLLVAATVKDIERLVEERHQEVLRIEREHKRDTHAYDEERHPLYHRVRWCTSEMRKLSYSFGRLLEIEGFMTTTSLNEIHHQIERWNDGTTNKYEPTRPFYAYGKILPY